jgi:hypothetical protein
MNHNTIPMASDFFNGLLAVLIISREGACVEVRGLSAGLALR